MGTRKIKAKTPARWRRISGATFPEDVLAEFRRIAKSHHRSMSGEVRHLVYEHLKCYEAPPMERTRRPRDDAEDDD
jgi:hypothetical protein